jgi:hypothetical protein
MRIINLAAGLGRRLGRIARPIRVAAGTSILAGGMVFAGPAEAQLFSEDFEGLTLGPFVSTTETGGDGTDWTNVLPAGWARDNGSTPPAGPPEFFGFTFLGKNSWIATAGNQDRTSFTRGSGTVMVADPDEYDDLPDIDPDQFNVLIRTPTISTAGVAANNLKLNFDSSFRPYDGMTGLVDVSFDGGATFANVLTLDTPSTPGGNSSLVRANESISLPLNNPGNGAGMVVRFRMTNAGNDWWWAVDNIVVATPEALALSLEVANNGELVIANRTDEAVYLDYYEIESPSDSLRLANWTSFDDRNVPGFPGGTGAGDGWEEGGNLDDGILSESFLSGQSVLQPGAIVSLGLGYDSVQDAEDLIFRYGAVPVEAASGTQIGDYDGSGMVDAADYSAWRAQFGSAGMDLPPDGSGNGVVDTADYVVWRNNLGSMGGIVATGPSFLTDGVVRYISSGVGGHTAIPEPQTILLAGLGMGSFVVGTRRKTPEN